ERWLNELLDTTAPAKVHPRPHQVRPWVKEVLASHRSAAQSRGVDLQLDDAGAPHIAVFDAHHMEQAVAAILSNAIEASPPGRAVQVRVSDSESSGAWEIRITDQGPGVPKDLRQKIFEPHFTTKSRGHGIGLAIARQVVLAHGGRVSVDTAPNGSPLG